MLRLKQRETKTEAANVRLESDFRGLVRVRLRRHNSLRSNEVKRAEHLVILGLRSKCNTFVLRKFVCSQIHVSLEVKSHLEMSIARTYFFCRVTPT